MKTGVGTRLRRALLAVVAATAAALVISGLAGISFPGGETTRIGFYYVALFGSVALLVARAAFDRNERLAWSFLALGLLLWAAADLVYYFMVPDDANPQGPSIPDIGYLAFYPCAFAALCLMAMRRLRGVNWTIWLDGLIGGLTVAALATTLAGPVFRSLGGPPLALATTAAYPVADITLLALAAFVAAMCGRRLDRGFGLLAFALSLFAVGDSLYLVEAARGTYAMGGLLDSSWAIAGAAMAIAAWNGRAAHAYRPAAIPLLLPAIFGAAATGLLVFDHFDPVNRVALALATAAVMVAVSRTVVFAGRYVAALREIGELARIDALTGLANRRAFLDDFAEMLLTVERGERWSLVLFDLDNFKAYNDTLGHPAGDAMLALLAGRLQESVKESGGAYRLGGDEFCILVRRNGEEDAVCRAAELALCAGGPSFSIDSSNGTVLIPEEAATTGDALRLADERLYRHKQARPGSVEQLLSEALLQAMAEHSPQFVEHHQNVAELAEALADAAGLSEADREETVRAAQLHDIGKLAVPDGILRKADPLSESEQALIRAHTVVGERILRVAASMRSVAHLVRSSHERWDGNGYPDRLAGPAIPIGARVVTICDSLDAMLTERPYAPSMPVDMALAELRRERGRQFDPVLVDLVLELAAEGRLPLRGRRGQVPILGQPARPWKAALANAAA